MDDAILRMAAPMYGLGYDDLKQRHREQRIRKMSLIASIVAGVFLIYAVTSTALSIHINNQRKIIADQHLQLEEDYRKQQIKFAQSMSLVSEELLQRGLGQAAVYSARMAMPDSLDDTETPYVPECQYALSNALGIYEVDVFFPEEIIDMPSESFWQGPGDYLFLETYLGGAQVICAAPFKSGYELIITSNSAIYLYDVEDGVLNDYSLSFFSEVPKEHIEAAAFKDDSLYILFSKSDSVVRYKYRSYDGYESAGKGSIEERTALRGKMTEIGDEIKSSDGKYIATRGTDNNLLIYSASDKKHKHCLKKIYDKSGIFCSMKKLEGTDYYLLTYTGKFAYLLDEDLNIIARVSNFYDYSAKKRSFILYHTEYNGLEYELYYMPLIEYEDIIKQADDLLAGFEPSDELIERYQIFKDGE